MSKESLNGRLCQIVDELVRSGLTLEQACNVFERQFIIRSLLVHQGSIGQSARSLGVHRNTLRNKITGLGIGEAEYLAQATARSTS